MIEVFCMISFVLLQLSHLSRLMPFRPLFHAFFDLLISLSQQGLIVLRLKSGLNFSKWPKQV